MTPKSLIATILLCLAQALATACAADLTQFSDEFWSWRSREQPFTSDDIPRIERPADFAVDWSAASVARYQRELRRFEDRWTALAPTADAPVAAQVDYRLLGSALSRVRWELEIERGWRRNPGFYVDQSLGAVYALLLPPPPFAPARQQAIVDRMRTIPQTLAAARQNLTDMRRPFAELAIAALDRVGERVTLATQRLAPLLSPATNASLRAALPPAIHALEAYRGWLQQQLPTARPDTAIGRDAYTFFLRDVALLPYTPEQLLELSRVEWSRAVAFETYQQSRIAGDPPAPLFANSAAQIAAERTAEAAVRRFLSERRLLTVPDAIQHYENRLLPDYLEPLQDLGETDDLTGPSRLAEPGTSYIREPSPDLGFFYRSTARDPRPIIVHEGVPGHYFQLCLGWRNADSVRRHYYDSGANEGLGFYAEEFMLQEGLFDDNPQTRATIYSFMRLRALRVEVDVRLALGQFTIEQAAAYLEKTVPMDAATARAEAAMFASTPGQAIAYQIGKIQILSLLADARRAAGDGFSLLAFNDSLWNNGNVPIALQRWELLHDPSEVPPLHPEAR